MWRDTMHIFGKKLILSWIVRDFGRCVDCRLAGSLLDHRSRHVDRGSAPFLKWYWQLAARVNIRRKLCSWLTACKILVLSSQSLQEGDRNSRTAQSRNLSQGSPNSTPAAYSS
jgi:hypothetical protein